MAVVIFVGRQTYLSTFEKTHRWIIYALLLISPVLGAIVFLYFQRVYYRQK